MKKIFNTKNLIYLTIIGTPLYLIRFDIFKIPTNLLEILIGTTLLFFIFDKEYKITKKIDKNLLIPMALIILGALISSLTGDNYRASFGILKGWFIIPIIFGFIVYFTIRTTKETSSVIASIFISTLIVSLVSSVYYLYGETTFDGRLKAFYLSPNHLAMFLAPGLLIGIINILKNNHKKFFIVSIIPIFLSIYLTYSYASWASISLTLFIIIFSGIFSNKNYSKIYFLVFIILSLSFLLLQKENPKFEDLISLDKRSSLSSRIMIWESSFKILSDNWIFGIGPGNFQDKYLEYQKYFPPYLEWAVPQPHNLYLAFWLQSGLTGIIGFMFLIYLWIKNQFLAIKKQPTIILLTVMIYFLIHGLVDTPYWKNDLSLVFWIIILLGFATPKLPASPRKKQFH